MARADDDDRCNGHGEAYKIDNPGGDVGLVGVNDPGAMVQLDGAGSADVIVFNDSPGKTAYVGRHGLRASRIEPNGKRSFVHVNDLTAKVNDDDVPVADRGWHGLACIQSPSRQ